MAAAAILVCGNCNLRTIELLVTKFEMGMYNMMYNTPPTPKLTFGKKHHGRSRRFGFRQASVTFEPHGTTTSSAIMISDCSGL